jgi:hypothetical protein
MAKLVKFKCLIFLRKMDIEFIQTNDYQKTKLFINVFIKYMKYSLFFYNLTIYKLYILSLRVLSIFKK